MITLTELAAQKTLQNLQRRGRGLGIKIGVRTTGCSGLAYMLEFVDEDPDIKEYQCFESHGVRVWVDARSLPYVSGLTMDWVRQGLNEGFDFVNPNELDRCGCGESFRPR
jgi:iron-sulfur cluster assembly protein